MSNDADLELIDLVKDRKILYTNGGSRSNIWIEVSNILINLGYKQMTADHTIQRWKTLRDGYVKQDQKLITKPNTNITFPYFKAMAFLAPHITHKNVIVSQTAVEEVELHAHDPQVINEGGIETNSLNKKLPKVTSIISLPAESIRINKVIPSTFINENVPTHKSSKPECLEIKGKRLLENTAKPAGKKAPYQEETIESLFKNFPVRSNKTAQVQTSAVRQQFNEIKTASKNRGARNIPEYDKFAKIKSNALQKEKESLDEATKMFIKLLEVVINYYLKKTLRIENTPSEIIKTQNNNVHLNRKQRHSKGMLLDSYQKLIKKELRTIPKHKKKIAIVMLLNKIKEAKNLTSL